LENSQSTPLFFSTSLITIALQPETWSISICTTLAQVQSAIGQPTSSIHQNQTSIAAIYSILYYWPTLENYQTIRDNFQDIIELG